MASMTNQWTREEAAHLLNRAGFGGSPGEIDDLHRKGREGAVDWLLEARDEVALPDWAGKRSELMVKLAELRGAGRRGGREERERNRREIQQMFNREQREQGLDLLVWWLRRMRSGEAPLQEKMVFFWHDHFATSSQKVKRSQFMLDQNELFRKHALGNFGALARAIVTDPAMMLYLDSAQSDKRKPNENFARELMELFMLGEGNYTEEDVKEAARALTGYRLNRLTGEVTHVVRNWDEGEKVILGEKGTFDGDGVVNLILARPRCGEFLCAKLFSYFGYENPSSGLVTRLAAVLANANYELKPVLRAIFLSEEFYSSQSLRTRIKSPVEYVIMLSRQLEAGLPPDRILFQLLQQLGQVPMLPPNVAGWDWGKAWVNTNTLITRYHVAGMMTGAGGDPKLAMGDKGGKFLDSPGGARFFKSRMPAPDYEKIAPRDVRENIPALVTLLADRFFQAPLREKDRKAFEEYAAAKKGVVFTNTEVAELIHLMLSTPVYQLG